MEHSKLELYSKIIFMIIITPQPSSDGEFHKGKERGNSSRCWTLGAFLCSRRESRGEAFEGQQPLTELRGSDAPLPWTGRNDSGTSARWPLLSHLTERH